MSENANDVPGIGLNNVNALMDSVTTINNYLNSTSNKEDLKQTLSCNARHIRFCLDRADYLALLSNDQVSVLTATATLAETTLAALPV